MRYGLSAVLGLGALVACNTYGPDLLVDADPDTTGDGSPTSDSTLTTGSGGSTSQVTTTINTVTGTSASTSGGDGGSGSSSSASGNDTMTNGGGSGGDSTTSSTGTETETTTTSAGGGGNGGSGGGGGGTDTTGGGSGGTDTTGGGSGGSGTTGIDVLLIDDLEDGNNQLETPTYSGYWFTAVDESGSGEVIPEPGEQCRPVDLETPRGESERAMHVSGTWTDSEEWIAAVGFALQDDESPVDASNYAGVTFYARTDDDDTQIRLQVMITDVDDNGHYAIELELSSSWEEYTVLWGNDLLIQPSWAVPVPFDAAHLYKFQFQFDSESFDLWIDDFRFVEP